MASFDEFKGILPYASELFGIYQPLLGWRSHRTAERYQRFRVSLYNELAARALVNARPAVTVNSTWRARPASPRPISPPSPSRSSPPRSRPAIAPRLSTSIDTGAPHARRHPTAASARLDPSPHGRPRPAAS
jgi:hypothetical protein